MKIVVAPNAFKGTILSEDVAAAITTGIKRVLPDAEVVEAPVSDGGDGSLSTFLDIFDGISRASTVCGPLGEPVEAEWGIINDGKTAFIETALAFGLALVPLEKRNPSITTSRGVGDLIVSALDLGLRDFIIAVGGSANNDGGTGVLRALGAKFLDEKGRELEDGGLALQRLAHIELGHIDHRIKESTILVLSDSSVPLTGEIGVSIMYSPGKGASKEMAYDLDKALRHYAEIIRRQYGVDVEKMPCAGSGGGVVCAIEVFLNAHRAFGIDVVLEKLKFDTLLSGADLVITGEGMVDTQTIYNKAPIGVAQAAARANIPVLVVCAKLGEGFEKVYAHGVDAIVAIGEGRGWCGSEKTVDEDLLRLSAEDVFKQLKATGDFSLKRVKRFYNVSKIK
jgi:glycerate kinase